jgi:2'-5' RNA ligase
MALTTPPAMHKVFIGIPIDKNSQRKINELLGPIKKSLQDVRWVPAGNRHLTLAFIGNIPGSVVKNLSRQFDESYQQEAHFQYNMSSLTRFPDSKGRIIALVDDPARSLNKLFQITLALLQRNNINFCQKKFRPHITLGRIKRPKHGTPDLDRQINIKLNIAKIVLYLSTSTESGPIYTTLKRTRLSQAQVNTTYTCEIPD